MEFAGKFRDDGQSLLLQIAYFVLSVAALIETFQRKRSAQESKAIAQLPQ